MDISKKSTYQELMQAQTQAGQTYVPGSTAIGQYQPHVARPCPTCGTCPTCGAKGWGYMQPQITWGDTGYVRNATGLIK